MKFILNKSKTEISRGLLSMLAMDRFPAFCHAEEQLAPVVLLPWVNRPIE